MHKNILLYFLGITLIFMGCQKKTTDIFEKSPDERLAEALANYRQTLMNAPNGWKMVIIPKGLASQGIDVGGFYYYMKFTDSNRVVMLSDFDEEMASTPKESGYRLKAVQRPSIYFDTYSYLHTPADPTATISRTPAGNNGIGWGTDFDFAFADNGSGDTIKLKGNFNSSEAMLIKATAQEATAFNNKQLAASIQLLQNLDVIGYFKVLTIGSKQYSINIDAGNRLVTLSWLDGSGNIQSTTTGYYSTLTGIMFTTPVNTGSSTIAGIGFISWNSATITMNVTVNGASGTISNAGHPLKLDVNAPARWWKYSNDNGLPWISGDGFTVNGVRDAYKINSIPRFYVLGYWSWYGTSGSTNYDLLSFYKINDAGTGLDLPYGAAYNKPTFTNDGRAIFPLFGTLGTIPAAEQTIFENVSNKMADPNGYYFIQTGPLQYDMVSKDGKSWITWQWPK